MAAAAAPGVRIGLEDNLWMDAARSRPASNSELVESVHRLAEVVGRPIMTPAQLRERLFRGHGVYQWFRARATGETMTLFGADGGEAARFVFPRQPAGERLCLSDYVREDRDDYVALFAWAFALQVAGVTVLEVAGKLVTSATSNAAPASPK